MKIHAIEVMGKLKVVVNDGAREFNQLAVTYPNFSDGSRENSIRHRFCVQLGTPVLNRLTEHDCESMAVA